MKTSFFSNKISFYFLLFFLSLAAILPVAYFNSCNFGDATQAQDRGLLHLNRGLQILSATPQGLVEDINQFYSVVIVFNQAMAPLEALPEGDGSGPMKIEPAVKGKFRWLGTNTLSFTPSERLTLASRYKVTIPAGLKAMSGERLENSYIFNFETTRPKFVHSNIYDLARGVTISPKIFLLFNQPIALPDAISKIKLTDENRNQAMDIRIKLADTILVKEYLQNYNYDYSLSAAPDLKSRLLVVTTETPLSMLTDYLLTIKAGVSGITGTLGSAEASMIHFTTYGPLELIRFAEPESPSKPIRLKLSNRVDSEELRSRLSIKPEAEIQYIYDSYWDDDYTTSIYLDLQPRTSYELRIDKDLTDDFGNKLGNDAVQLFTTGDYESAAQFKDGEHIIESYLSHDFNVPVINPKQVHIRMAKLSEKDIIYVLNEGLWKQNLYFNNWQSSRSEVPDVELNKQSIYSIKLDEILAGETNANILVEFKHAAETYARRAIVQLTEIGITAKFSRLNNLIYVTQLKDAKPVADAVVEVRGDDRRIVWSGRTDDKGFVKTPGWESLGLKSRNEWSEPRQWVFVSKAGLKAYANSERRVDLYRFNIPTSWRSRTGDRSSAMLFTNQGIYRPGDKVLIKAVIRKLENDAWAVTPEQTLNVKIFNPSSEEIFAKEYSTNTMGGFDLEYSTDPNAPLGYYSIRVYDGNEELNSESFQVQEFKPVETEVTIHTDKEDYVWGEKLKATMDGHYLFGAPMSHAPMKWSLSKSKSAFFPPGYDDYFFGALTDDYYGYRWSYSTVLTSKTDTLNERGLLDVSFKLSGGNSETSTIVIEGEVTDKNRQVVSGRKSVTVHAGRYYIGLKPSTTFHTLGSAMNMEVIAVDPKGDKLKGRSVQLELVRREWVSVREKTGDGTFQWNSQIKDSIEKIYNVTSGDRPMVLQLEPTNTGYYMIKASGKDDLGNSIFSSCYVYVTGEGYTGWSLRDDDAIDLVADRKSYDPGETAKILVKSPYEECTALVTIEREGVLSHKPVKLRGNASFIEIPVNKEMIPNAYVSIILLQGRTSEPTADRFEDLGKPAFRIGYTKLAVNSDENKLDVAYKLNKEKFSPNEWVDLSLQVKDRKGKGKAAEVVVYVEDIGVLNLVNYKTPDLFSYFYQHRELGVVTSESRKFVLDQIVQTNLKEKGGVGGGGGDEMFAAVAVRKNFKACVFWDPSVMTDRNGRASIRFQLPENLTGFKIIAVAHTADSKFGHAEKNITVSKQLMLRPALPRFARVGDELQAGVIVHNYSDRDGTVKIITEMNGAELTDQKTREIFLKKGGAEEIRYSFQIKENKTGTFTFKAVMHDLTDGVEVKIPLKIPTYSETVATYGSATESKKEEIRVPKNIYEDFGGVYVKTSSTALVDLDGSVRYLFEYPYGCLEQKTSRVLPVLLFGDVVQAFGLEAFPDGKTNINEVVQQYLDEVPKFQQFSGGFGYWTGSGYVSPYVSVYTMFALTQAKQKGYAVNAECYERGISYLKSMVRQSTLPDRFGLFYWHTTNAFALSVLAENGYYDAPSVELLFQRRDELPLYAKAMLLRTVVKGKGNPAIAAELRRQLLNAIKMNPTTAHFEEPVSSGLEWTFHSNVRATAAILQVFLETEKENVPWAEKAVRHLLQDRKDGRWRTTQENVYVFWALGNYFNVFENEEPNLKVRVMLAGRQIMDEMYKGRTVESHTARIGFEQLSKGENLPLNFDHSGTGRLYYTLRITYAPRSGVKIKARDEGIKITKIFLDEKGKTVADGKFKAGEIYKIRLEVSSAQDRKFVVLDDPLPAGFEPVNVNLATSSSAAMENTGNISGSGWWDYGTFNNSEMRDDRVLVFADRLSQGTHTFTYLARATTLGRFELPSTKAEEMYAPEIFGNTINQTVAVE
jgi:hypothetical protein